MTEGGGAEGTPGAVVRTEWKTGDIWLQREATLAEVPAGEVWLAVHHDEDAEVYVNGVLAAKLTGFSRDYVEAALSPEARRPTVRRVEDATRRDEGTIEPDGDADSAGEPRQGGADGA